MVRMVSMALVALLFSGYSGIGSEPFAHGEQPAAELTAAQRKAQRSLATLAGLGGRVTGVAFTWNANMTDADLELVLSGFPGLEFLDLDSTPITDEGLHHIARLSRLRTLDLSYTKITNAGLGHLTGLPLQSLSLSGTTIADSGLLHIKGLPLQSLSLSFTDVSDAGLEHIKGKGLLKSLDLEDTQISDAGLVHIKTLATLQELTLSRTPVTDAGLEHLKGLCNLQFLDLSDTQATLAGINGLHATLPNALIAFSVAGDGDIDPTTKPKRVKIIRPPTEER